MSNPALWVAIAGVITAVTGLVKVLTHSHPDPGSQETPPGESPKQ